MCDYEVEENLLLIRDSCGGHDDSIILTVTFFKFLPSRKTAKYKLLDLDLTTHGKKSCFRMLLCRNFDVMLNSELLNAPLCAATNDPGK